MKMIFFWPLLSVLRWAVADSLFALKRLWLLNHRDITDIRGEQNTKLKMERQRTKLT